MRCREACLGGPGPNQLGGSIRVEGPSPALLRTFKHRQEAPIKLIAPIWTPRPTNGNQASTWPKVVSSKSQATRTVPRRRTFPRKLRRQRRRVISDPQGGEVPQLLAVGIIVQSALPPNQILERVHAIGYLSRDTGVPSKAIERACAMGAGAEEQHCFKPHSNVACARVSGHKGGRL